MSDTFQLQALDRTPFSRSLSRFFIYPYNSNNEEEIASGLYLSLTTDMITPIRKGGLVLLDPLYNGNVLPYRLLATPAKLVMETEQGNIEFCIDEPEILRIRAKGVGLRAFCRMGMMDTVCECGTSAMELNIGAASGKLLFNVNIGDIKFNQWWRMFDWRSDDVTADLLPNDEGRLEAAVHEYIAGVSPRDTYRPFDDCVEEAAESFLAWQKLYAEPVSDRDLFDLATYITWIGVQKPRKYCPSSKLCGETIYNRRCASDFAPMFEQFFHALAFKCEDTKLSIIKSIFRMQNFDGMLPAFTTDQQSQYAYTVPPVYALLLNAVNSSELLAAVQRNVRWWLKWRVSDRDPIPAYAYVKEAGFCAGLDFDDFGFTQSPDLVAYFVLLFSELAADTGEMEWKAFSEKALNILLNDMWNGRSFTAKKAESGIESALSGIVNYIPLILGDRLPKRIIEQLSNEISANDFWKVRNEIPVTALLVYGLIASGMYSASERVADWYVDQIKAHGFRNNAEDTVYSTWAASAYLYISAAVNPREGTD